jgi:hypothetical protein
MKDSFNFRRGTIYRGMTATLIADVAPYKFDGIHLLTDDSSLFETSDPRVEGSKWFFLLKVEGFYYLGGKSDMFVAVDPSYPSLLPLPLYVGRDVTRVTRYFINSPRLSGGRKSERRVFSARLVRLRGGILGQYRVRVEGEDHDCLLLRDHIASQVMQWSEDTEESYNYSVLLDRYIREDGLLHLEHIWYCEDGGKRSLSEAEAKRKGKTLFKKAEYAGREWYRVDGHVMKSGYWKRYP